MDTNVLISGAIYGAIFVGIAYAFSRHTRQILVAGLIAAALFYVFFAARAHAGPVWLAAELAGVAIYGAMALRGLRGSAWWLAAGWALHPIWDVALHYVGPGRSFAPETYATACLTWDPVVAVVIGASLVLRSRRAAATALGLPAPTARAG